MFYLTRPSPRASPHGLPFCRSRKRIFCLRHSYLKTLSLILAPNMSGSRPGVTGSGRPSPRKKSKNLVWSQFRKACDRCTDKKVILFFLFFFFRSAFRPFVRRGRAEYKTVNIRGVLTAVAACCCRRCRNRLPFLNPCDNRCCCAGLLSGIILMSFLVCSGAGESPTMQRHTFRPAFLSGKRYGATAATLPEASRPARLARGRESRASSASAVAQAPGKL